LGARHSPRVRDLAADHQPTSEDSQQHGNGSPERRAYPRNF
jgi:hypothetical protein